jgi:hypothetical protein
MIQQRSKRTRRDHRHDIGMGFAATNPTPEFACCLIHIVEL